VIAISISAFELLYWGLGILTLAAVVGGVAIWRHTPTPAGEPFASWGKGSDDRRWESEAQDAVHKQLTDVRTAATAWGKAISALLGVFTVVAFIKGPETFNGVKGKEATAAALLVLLAAVLAAGAVLLAALAEQGVPRKLKRFAGWELRHQTQVRAQTAAVQLAWSRILGVGAAIVVLASIGITWIAAQRDASKSEASQKALVVSDSGVVQCGTLVKQGSGLALKLADGTASTAAGARQVIKVSSCP
jgi:hypothetical protein